MLVVDDDAALSCSGRIANPASIAVSFQHGLPQTAEVLFMLTTERIASRAHAVRSMVSRPQRQCIASWMAFILRFIGLPSIREPVAIACCFDP